MRAFAAVVLTGVILLFAAGCDKKMGKSEAAIEAFAGNLPDFKTKAKVESSSMKIIHRPLTQENATDYLNSMSKQQFYSYQSEFGAQGSRYFYAPMFDPKEKGFEMIDVRVFIPNYFEQGAFSEVEFSLGTRDRAVKAADFDKIFKASKGSVKYVELQNFYANTTDMREDFDGYYHKITGFFGVFDKAQCHSDNATYWVCMKREGDIYTEWYARNVIGKEARIYWLKDDMFYQLL